MAKLPATRGRIMKTTKPKGRPVGPISGTKTPAGAVKRISRPTVFKPPLPPTRAVPKYGVDRSMVPDLIANRLSPATGSPHVRKYGAGGLEQGLKSFNAAVNKRFIAPRRKPAK